MALLAVLVLREKPRTFHRIIPSDHRPCRLLFRYSAWKAETWFFIHSFKKEGRMAGRAVKSERRRTRRAPRVLSPRHDRAQSKKLPPPCEHATVERVPPDMRCTRCGGLGVTLYFGDGFAQEHVEWHCINCGNVVGPLIQSTVKGQGRGILPMPR